MPHIKAKAWVHSRGTFSCLFAPAACSSPVAEVAGPGCCERRGIDLAIPVHLCVCVGGGVSLCSSSHSVTLVVAGPRHAMVPTLSTLCRGSPAYSIRLFIFETRSKLQPCPFTSSVAGSGGTTQDSTLVYTVRPALHLDRPYWHHS